MVQVFDAATNKWKLVDEKQHTDVFEKITEADDLIYRKEINDETTIINSSDSSRYINKFDEKHTKTSKNIELRSDQLLDESISTVFDNREDVTQNTKNQTRSSKVG